MRSTVAPVTYRAFDPPRDYPAAAALVSAANVDDGIDWLPTSQVLEHAFGSSATFTPAVDARVAEVEARMAGLLTADWRQRGEKVVHELELWVHPDDRLSGIGNDLVAWGEAHEAGRVAAGAGGPSGLRHEIGFGGVDATANSDLAVRRGYRAVRYFIEMRRRVDGHVPDAPLPEGLEVRPVRPEDHRRIWDADVDAFRDHWEASERSETDFASWFSRPHLDTTLWQVAWDGGEVAGSVMTSVDPDENARLGVRRAWLDHISVRRPWRHRGLAAALIGATLDLLLERGLDEAGLGVDAENPSGALRLYERMGFEQVRTGIVYRKELPLD